MIKDIKIKSIYINDKKADGTPYIDKNGNPFKMAVIENLEGKKASMFCGKFQIKDLEHIQTWKSGDTVRINLEQDGNFLNFSLPKQTDELAERIASLELRVSRLEGTKESKELFAPAEKEELAKMSDVLEKNTEEMTEAEIKSIPF